MGATMQWLWEYTLLSSLINYSFPPLQSGLKRLQNSCIAALRRGAIPQHIAIIMDGNRRYARSVRIDTAEGHYSGAETLKNVSQHLI
jgi:ditrans,polycis-polyprenyl diphosphate synthase